MADGGREMVFCGVGEGAGLPTVWGRNKLLVSHTVFLYETFHYYIYYYTRTSARARLYRRVYTLTSLSEFFVRCVCVYVVRDRKLCSRLSDSRVEVPPTPPLTQNNNNNNDDDDDDNIIDVL